MNDIKLKTTRDFLFQDPIKLVTLPKDTPMQVIKSLLSFLVLCVVIMIALHAQTVNIAADCLKTSDIFEKSDIDSELFCNIKNTTTIIKKNDINKKLEQLKIKSTLSEDLVVNRLEYNLTEQDIIEFAKNTLESYYPNTTISIGKLSSLPPLKAFTKSDISVSLAKVSLGNLDIIVKKGDEIYHIYTKATGTRKVLVALQNIKNGDLVEGKTALEDVDITYLREELLDNPSGYVATRYIQAGKPISLSVVGTMPVAKKGDTVYVIYNSGGVVLRISGQLLADAYLNRPVSIKNNDTGKIMVGIVHEDGYAYIK